MVVNGEELRNWKERF